VAGFLGGSDAIPVPSGDRASGGSDVSIYHLNPPMLLPGLILSGLAAYYRCYSIGYWAWELETLPPEWIKAVRVLHAIVVPSTFCRDAVQRYTSKPVLVVPHPVGKLGALQRAVKSDPHPFRVVNIFRFGSSFERKNPLALLRAFQRAFGRDPTARL